MFCCQGCLAVHDLLSANGLAQFYNLSPHPGSRAQGAVPRENWAFLDEPSVRQRLLDFSDERLSRVTFRIPTIHCVACVWLLENLFRLHPGIIGCRVDFSRREAAIHFAADQIRLSGVVALLASIGYAPQLTLGELEKAVPNPARKRLWLQIGIAGFAFGNIMLLSLPAYLGLDSTSEPQLKNLFGYLSLALAAPVVVFSAADYWRSAGLAFRQRVLTLDVPIALGLAALYLQSAIAIVLGRGEPYLDSLAGLVFFLLCGRAFQQKTFDRLEFDRDYKCFFPLSITRRNGSSQETVAISSLEVGDRLLVRNDEILPADARLVSGPACIDYSFVTGESEPVRPTPGDYLYAGGKQMGATIEAQTLKAVSQSYLTSLWNHAVFGKKRQHAVQSLTNRYSRGFTGIVVAIAVGAALVWALSGHPARAMRAFTSVLIVACPCALALAAPFTLGTGQRLLGRRQVFVRNPLMLERLAEVNAVVFDKTGTLTTPGGSDAQFVGGRLSMAEMAWVEAVTRHSTHPHAMAICQAMGEPQARAENSAERQGEALQNAGQMENRIEVQPGSFQELPGRGMVAVVVRHEVRLGSRRWLEESGVDFSATRDPAGSVSYLAIDGQFRGAFVVAQGLARETVASLKVLNENCDLALLSGDNDRDRERFAAIFGAGGHLHFNQSPREKLHFIERLQQQGKVVMMVGDGLNDAGALKQSDVGVAVVEKIGRFSPASDIILPVEQVAQLSKVLALARRSASIIRLSFGLSAMYNAVGIGLAAAGILSPVICAILMPLSSVSVVLFACGATTWAAKRAGLNPL